MDPQIYEEIWQSFITGDHITQGTIWGGEGLALIVPVEQPNVVACIQEVQSILLSELPFQPHLPETLHITMHLFGNPSSDRLPDLFRFLSETLPSFPPFFIHVKGINSFFRAPIVEIYEDGILNAIMKSLMPGIKERAFPEFDYGPRGQVMHITLGAYTQENDGSKARQLLTRLRTFDAGKIFVDELRLIKTSAGKPYRMTTLETFPLRGK